MPTSIPRALRTALVSLPVSMLLGACVHVSSHHATPGKSHESASGHAMAQGKMAMSTLTPTQGHAVRGMVMFHEHGDHLMVHARITGLKPGAEHGFHLHEKGDCASADGSSAGGHFNPDGQPHGPQGAARHAGDMPALKANDKGEVDQKFTLHGPTVSAGPRQIVGRSVIVHAGPDDYSTQPTGNSGARIACGVVAGH